MEEFRELQAVAAHEAGCGVVATLVGVHLDGVRVARPGWRRGVVPWFEPISRRIARDEGDGRAGILAAQYFAVMFAGVFAEAQIRRRTGDDEPDYAACTGPGHAEALRQVNAALDESERVDALLKGRDCAADLLRQHWPAVVRVSQLFLARPEGLVAASVAAIVAATGPAAYLPAATESAP